MKEFNTISAFYVHLESYDGSYPSKANINKALVKLSESTDENTKARIEWERTILNFTLREGIAEPFWSTTSQDGKVISYPSLQFITKDAYSYLKKRAAEVKNPMLIIQYNHILWLSKYKHKDFANKTLETYLSLLQTPNENKFDLLTNAIALSLECKLYINEFKSVFRKLVLENNDIKDYEVIFLISFALKTNKYKKEDFKDFIERINNINQTLEKDKKYFAITENLEVSVRLAKMLQISFMQFLYDIGKYNELAADEQTSKGIAQLLYYAKSLEYFSLCKADKESQRVASKIKDINDKIDLPVYTREFDITEVARFYEKLKKQLLNESSDTILNNLSRHNPIIFPHLDSLIKQAKKRKVNILDMITSTSFDINSNINKDDSSDEAVTRKKLYHLYKIQIGVKLQVFLKPLFIDGVKEGIINYNTFENYISNSWLKENLVQNRSGEKIEYNWWQLLAPGVQEIFSQIEIYNNIGKFNMTLAIDSLTLKFEGMFREFALIQNIQTIQPKKKSKEVSIQEVYLEQILSHPKMMELFDESDRLLFNFVLSKNGLDLRNNIAHSFLRPQDYSFDKVILILLAILRIAKYKLVKADS